MTMTPSQSEEANSNRWLWIALLTIANVILSGKFACATPFAALAALAALDMNKRDGLILVGAMWLSNQILGYTLLGYPHEAQSYAWGVAIGIGAVVALYAVYAMKPYLVSMGRIATVVGAFLVAFAAYQAVMVVGAFAISDGHNAFAFNVVRYVAEASAVAYVVLLIVHQLAVMAGLMKQSQATLFPSRS